MASIQKRGKTYQYTVSRIINGKQDPIRKGGFRTKKEAQVAAAEIESQLANRLNPVIKNISLVKYFEGWVELYKLPIVSSTTLRHYKYSLSAINQYFTDMPIQQIKRQDYQKFLNWFGKNKAKETVTKVHSHIRSCVKDAMEEQLIQIDFTRKTQAIWTVNAKSSIEKHLNYNESKQLLKSIWSNIKNGLGYSLILLGLTSGMRFGELVGLTRDDFNFHNNTISINKTWGYKKDSLKGFGTTKNEQSNRIIKMDRITMKHFKDLFKTTPMNIHQLVFYSPESKYKVISNTNANKLLKNLLIKLDIEPKTIHGLRHTHASVLLYQKASISYVSERLGHSDIETTLKQYTHVLRELRLEEEELAMNTFESMIIK